MATSCVYDILHYPHTIIIDDLRTIVHPHGLYCIGIRTLCPDASNRERFRMASRMFVCNSLLYHGTRISDASDLTGRGKKGVLRAKLRGAKTWEEWKEAAKVMDDYLGFDEWKKVRWSPLISQSDWCS